MSRRQLVFGVPKEIMTNESRVAVIPETAAKLKANGAHVIVQSGAGKGALYDDNSYIAVGAEIVEDVMDIYSRADIILKVKEPQFNTELNMHEVDLMHEGQYLVAFLHPAFPGNREMVMKLATNGINSLTLDSIPRISRTQTMDALTSMSIVAGYKGMLIASNLLPRFVPIIAAASCVVQPSQVLVIGTGVAGLQALATAKRFGAVVTGVDIRHDASEQVVSMGAKAVELNIPRELAEGEGGYAKALPPEWLAREREILTGHVKTSDIVILSALVPGKIAPVLLTRSMVGSMKPGSVIVDIAIDQGGNCELTESGSIVNKNDITIIGIKNIPGSVPQSATTLLASNIFHFVEYLTRDGRIDLDRGDDILSPCLVTCGGDIVHEGARESMGI